MKEIPKEFAVVATVPGFKDLASIIGGLRAKYHGRVYDVSTTQGMQDAVAARRELRDARIALDKKKPEVKAEALKFCATVEDEYKTIRAAILEYEAIPDGIIKAEEDRKEREKEAERRKEEERRSVIIERLQRIAAIPTHAISLSAAETEGLITKTVALEILGEDFQEFLSKALTCKETVVAELRKMHTAKVAQEEEAARLAEARKAQEERERQEAIEREKIRQEQEAEAARLRAEREKFEAEQAEIRRKQEEAEATRRREWEEAQAALRQREEAVKAEQDRLAAIAAEEERKRREEEESAKREEQRKAEDAAQEKAEKAMEKARAEAEKQAKKLVDPIDALTAIYAITQDPGIVPTLAIRKIEAIAKKFTKKEGELPL